MKNIEFIRTNNIYNIYNSIIEFIYSYTKQTKNDHPIKQVGSFLYEIQYKDLTNWDVRPFFTGRKSYFEDVGSKKLNGYNENIPTMVLLANKVYHMLYNLHDPNGVYNMLYSCAYKPPKKLHLSPNIDDDRPDYGVFLDYEATYERELRQTFPDGKQIYKNIKQPKGHFRLERDIHVLTQDEQNYLKKLFE